MAATSGKESARLFVTLTAETQELKRRLDEADKRWNRTVSNTERAVSKIDSSSRRAGQAADRFGSSSTRAANATGQAWEQNAAKAQRSMDRMRTRMVGMERTALRFAKYGAIGVATGMAAVGVASLKAAGNMEQSRLAFTKLLGSARKADAFIASMKAFAKNTPFEYTDIQNYSKRLLAMGFQAREVIPTMTTLGNAVSAVGGDAQTLDRVVLAIAQIKTKGKVSAEEMNQLAEAGIPAWDMLAKSMGKSTAEIMKMSQSTKGIGADKALPALMGQMNRRFGGMMQKQSRTLLGLWSNFKDQLGMQLADIGAMIIDKFNLKQKLESVINKISTDEFKAQVMDAAEATGRFVNALGEAVGWLWKNRDALMAVTVAAAGAYAAMRTLMIVNSVAAGFRALSSAGAAASAATTMTTAAGAAGTAGRSFGLLRTAMLGVPFGPWGVAATAAAGGLAYLVTQNKLGGSEAERHAEKVDKLVAELNKIPKEKRTTVTVTTKRGGDGKSTGNPTKDAKGIQEDVRSEANRIQTIKRAQGELAKMNESIRNSARDHVNALERGADAERDLVTASKQYVDLQRQLDGLDKNSPTFLAQQSQLMSQQIAAGQRMAAAERDVARWAEKAKKARQESASIRQSRNTLAATLGIKYNDGGTGTRLQSMFRTLTAQSARSVQDINRELAKIGIAGPMKQGVAEKILGDLPAAARKAKFGTDNINEILSRAGIAKPDGTWGRSLGRTINRGVSAAGAGKDNVNSKLSAAGNVRADGGNWLSSIQSLWQSASSWLNGRPLTVKVKTQRAATNRNSGGLIPGRGPDRDTVPAMLTQGEYVIRRSAVDRVGVGYLDAINEGRAGFNSGGRVGRRRPRAASSGSYIAGAGFRASETPQALGKKLRQQISELNRLQKPEQKALDAYTKAQSAFKNTKKTDSKYDDRRYARDEAKAKLDDIRERRKGISDEIVSLRSRIKDSLSQGTGLNGLRNSMAAQMAGIDVQIAEAMLTESTDDDKTAYTSAFEAAKSNAEKLRALISSGSLKGQDLIDAKSDLASTLQSQAGYAQQLRDLNSAPSESQDEADRRERENSTLRERLRISEAGNAAFSGAGDIGYGGGGNAFQSAAGVRPQVVYNINALSSNTPEVQRAMASAYNGGISNGGYADQLYSGRA